MGNKKVYENDVHTIGNSSFLGGVIPSKLVDEFYVFIRLRIIKVCIIRFFNTVGPGQTGRCDGNS